MLRNRPLGLSTRFYGIAQWNLCAGCSKSPYSDPKSFRCESESDEPCAWNTKTTNRELTWKKGTGIFQKKVFRQKFGLVRRPSESDCKHGCTGVGAPLLKGQCNPKKRVCLKAREIMRRVTFIIRPMSKCPSLMRYEPPKFHFGGFFRLMSKFLSKRISTTAKSRKEDGTTQDCVPKGGKYSQ